jgi:hypothetical protein
MQADQRKWLYRAEIAMCIVSAALFVLTLIDPQWIETLFDESPDGGDGSFEQAILLGCTALATVLAGVLAWRERRRVSAG